MPTKRKTPAKRSRGRRAVPRSLQPRRQPETLRLRSVAPTLTVNDIERSLAWYRDVLGFTVSDRWQEQGRLPGVELKAGAATFLLTQDDWAKGRDRRKGEGFRLWCRTAQDLDGLAAAIKARGGRLDQEPRLTSWGARVLMVTDPDGFKLSFVAAR